MNSMTGYGKGIVETNERKITIEMKSVNHRYLDLQFKIPKSFAFLENDLKNLIKKDVFRGHIDIYLSYEDNRKEKAQVIIDENIALQYKKIGENLKNIGFKNDITASQLLKLPDILETKIVEDNQDEIKNIATKALEVSMDNLLSMRKTEGEMLKNDINIKLLEIQKIVSKVVQRAPLVVQEYKEKLKTRIEECLQQVDFDEARLINEVAYFSDKTSIDEEITRLFGHIEHAKSIIDETGNIGKKLDFLVQEMNREINTIGSKCNDLEISQNVLLLKNEVEKIREQVQNIE